MREKKISTKGIFKQGFRIFIFFFSVILIMLGLFFIYGYYQAKKPISYLPNADSSCFHLTGTFNKYVLKNRYYNLQIDSVGKISVSNSENEQILSGLLFYSDYQNAGEKWGLLDVHVEIVNDSTASVRGKGLNETDVEIQILCHRNESKVAFQTICRYNLESVIKRESIIAQFSVPLSNLYLKNRKVISGSFEPEYWLDKQGASFGVGDRAALLYHTPDISSLQLKTAENTLFINLDYEKDHPFVYFPYNNGTTMKVIDYSSSVYHQGSQRINKFEIYFGKTPRIIPRLMLVPQGYLAGYVFTEHADGATLKSNRAIYFGSEDITEARNAKGGFVGHHIPITKSVFYIDPGENFVALRGCSDSALFLNFLDQLYAQNYDICLHTPDNLNSSRGILNEALRFMAQRFQTKSWIDHGVYNGRINREAFVCDGLDSTAELFTADLWKKNGTVYFWNTANEYFNDIGITAEIRNLNFSNAFKRLWSSMSSKELSENGFLNSTLEMVKRRKYLKDELNSMNNRKGCSTPTPLYYKNQTVSGEFYSWITDYPKEYKNENKEMVNFEKHELCQLVSDWGVFIHHGYFARVPGNLYGNDGVIVYDKNKMIIEPKFDQVLGIMEQMKENGDLYTTTISELMDYWTQLEKVHFDYLSDNRILITNDNIRPIKGISIAIHRAKISSPDKNLKSKKVDEENIYWFDIEANESIILEII